MNRINSQLWELYNKRPNDKALAKDEKAQPKKDMPVELPPEEAALEEAKVVRPTFDFLFNELQPSIAVLFHGAPFHTNRWGMRGKDYEMKPPPGTCRIALIGSSPELGSGVSDDQVWATILENQLNRENDRKKVAQYEILNFSVGGYAALQRLRAFETKALSFDPDIVRGSSSRSNHIDSSACSVGDKGDRDSLRLLEAGDTPGRDRRRNESHRG